MPHKTKSLVALIALSTHAALALASNAVGGLGPYRVSFEALAAVDAEYSPRSVITITNRFLKEPVSRELSSFTPGCGDVPAIAALSEQYIALCGHLGGRHYTYRLLRVGGAGLESASLDTFDKASPLVFNSNGALETLVLRRDKLPGKVVGPIYFPYVYVLRSDPSSFGFFPIYGEPVKSTYLNFYNRTFQSTSSSQSLPALLAALLATQDKQFICGEVKNLKNNWSGSPGEVAPFDEVLQFWGRELPKLGYPTFDFNHC